MRLDRLLMGVDVRSVDGGDPAATEVTLVTHDSRQVTPGALYCCVVGSRVDGHQFASEAVGAGAVALLCEHPVDASAVQVVVASTRAAMGPVAAAFYHHPSHDLTVVGVTGTNGKTTTAHLLAAIFEAHGWRTGVLGTLSGIRTTPEAPELQARLAAFLGEGRAAVAMEVSSHALAQHRVDAVRFSAAVFTNLSQDHLDFHHSMEEYFEAKSRLFAPGRSDVAVINGDDPWGQRLLATVPGARSFGLVDAVSADVGPRSSTFLWRGQAVQLGLGGRVNVANALAAATTAEALGIPARVVADGLSTATPIPGRYESIDLGQDFSVLVDYAHTPDALEQVLASAREGLAAGHRLTVVFGCGGDRDREKRPLMGEVATRAADLTVLTSDNPRGEDPQAIIDEVLQGVPADRRSRLVVEVDRRAAITRAVDQAGGGDVIVIAGKGHETGQEFAGRIEPFDDRAVAREAIRAAMRVAEGRS